MSRPSIDIFADLSDRETKRRIMASIGAMVGDYRVVIKPKRMTRSQRQNAYYFGTAVSMFAEYLNAQGEAVTVLEAHHLIASKFLRKTVIDPATERPLGDTIRSTTDLDTAEFAAFMDETIAWLADQFNIIVPDPN